ncbi:hypothetical protein FIU88_17360 [Halomonas sp. THAF12]|uniref:hypothetical protein n=1 Tax=Halomonas sp. THAF12 TaxID=2587849 RepID=UPI001268FE4C|nr:hypothetical protein [Halomonas sp. THAF12]QFT86716.1 hypothetical protein FIU88_17360 [Halomonas sp. THAF12]
MTPNRHPFVVGREYWLFNLTQSDARSSAALYSLIETAETSSLLPYEYLQFVFETLPTFGEEAGLSSLLLALEGDPTGLRGADTDEVSGSHRSGRPDGKSGCTTLAEPVRGIFKAIYYRMSLVLDTENLSPWLGSTLHHVAHYLPA